MRVIGPPEIHFTAVGLGNRLKVRAQRQTHSTLQLSLSVQIVGYPKEETDRVRQRLSLLVLKVLCSGIFHAFGHLLEDGATTNRFVRRNLSCCYRVQSLVEEPSTEQAFCASSRRLDLALTPRGLASVQNPKIGGPRCVTLPISSVPFSHRIF